MKKGVQRWKNAQHVPATYGLDGDALKKLTKALVDNSGDCRLLLRHGLYEDGSPTMWWELKSGDVSVESGNVVWTCPPRPPEDCE